jgi:hypothetical protein
MRFGEKEARLSEEGQQKAPSKKATTKKKRTSAKRADGATTAKGKHWTFPKNTLEATISIPKAIEEKNAGNPMPAQDLAAAVGFRMASDWRFTDLLKSANLYGLVSGTGATASISLTPLGQDVVAPSSPSQRTQALLSAFRHVEEFAGVEKFYGGKRIPEDEFFLNTLTREFKIPRDRVDVFSKVFTENLKYLRAFSGSLPTNEQVTATAETTHLVTLPESVGTAPAIRETRVREFLDTCFVMMPFGDWFDRYYQEIYVPAIQEAGFEPVRADELFSTGSVMEQIWEQIEKAKLLLADVSGKRVAINSRILEAVRRRGL